MAKKERIVKYTDEELTNLVEKEGTLSDWEKAADMTKADIEANIRKALEE